MTQYNKGNSQRASSIAPYLTTLRTFFAAMMSKNDFLLRQNGKENTKRPKPTKTLFRISFKGTSRELNASGIELNGLSAIFQLAFSFQNYMTMFLLIKYTYPYRTGHDTITTKEATFVFKIDSLTLSSPFFVYHYCMGFSLPHALLFCFFVVCCM